MYLPKLGIEQMRNNMQVAIVYIDIKQDEFNILRNSMRFDWGNIVEIIILIMYII